MISIKMDDKNKLLEVFHKIDPAEMHYVFSKRMRDSSGLTQVV